MRASARLDCEPGGRGKCLPAAQWFLSLHQLFTLPLMCCLGQGRLLQRRENCLCSSAPVQQGPDWDFEDVYASLLLCLPQGSWSKDGAPRCCHQPCVLSRCCWSDHNIWARFSKGFQDMVPVWCQPWPC